MIEAPPLSHLFTVLYQDGSTFTQPADDHSSTEGGSAFSDVNQAEVVVFYLESGVDGSVDKHLYSVDLRDGTFEIDGVTFRLGPDTDMKVGQQRKLVFFRRVLHQQETKIVSGKVDRTVFRSYHIGYEIDGQARTIEVGHEAYSV